MTIRKAPQSLLLPHKRVYDSASTGLQEISFTLNYFNAASNKCQNVKEI